MTRTVTQLTPEAERLLLAFDLLETGVAMMRQTLRRRHPNASPDELEALFRTWLEHRPEAPDGDCPGRSIDPAGLLR